MSGHKPPPRCDDALSQFVGGPHMPTLVAIILFLVCVLVALSALTGIGEMLTQPHAELGWQFEGIGVSSDGEEVYYECSCIVEESDG